MLSAQTPIVLNETLFELNQEIWTSYDLKQFVKAKSKTPLRLDFFNTAENEYDLFLASRLLFYQMMDSMGTVEAAKYKLSEKLIGADQAVEFEVLKIKLLNDITDSKVKTPSTEAKYDMWVNYMKKKYNFISQK